MNVYYPSKNFKELIEVRNEIFTEIKLRFKQKEAQFDSREDKYYIEDIFSPSANIPNECLEFTFAEKGFKLQTEIYPITNIMLFNTYVRERIGDEYNWVYYDDMTFSIQKDAADYYILIFKNGDTSNAQRQDRTKWGLSYLIKFLECNRYRESSIDYLREPINSEN